jgi:hypothetical protein
MQFQACMNLGGFLVACLGALAIGCGDGHDHDAWDGNQVPVVPTTAPMTVAIDTGATITAQPGGGVGVFVEYAAGGHWSARTSCDTPTSGAACTFELFFRGTDASSVLSNPKGQNIAGADTVDILGDGSLHFYSETSTNLDGFTFDATPGATLQLEMYLDTAEQPRFVYWIGQSVLHTGAPTDPINLAPTTP